MNFCDERNEYFFLICGWGGKNSKLISIIQNIFIMMMIALIYKKIYDFHKYFKPDSFKVKRIINLLFEEGWLMIDEKIKEGR